MFFKHFSTKKPLAQAKFLDLEEILAKAKCLRMETQKHLQKTHDEDIVNRAILRNLLQVEDNVRKCQEIMKAAEDGGWSPEKLETRQKEIDQQWIELVAEMDAFGL